jgi:hypothetical protein
MSATTSKRLVTAAMRKLGVLPRGKEPSANELADGRNALARMLDTWRLESLMVIAKSDVRFDLVTDKRSYTYSSAGSSDFVGARPVAILAATIDDGAGQTWPLLPITVREYSELPHKDTPGTPTRYCYFANYPEATIAFDRLPLEPYVRLIVQAPVAELPAVDTDEFELAPGYEDAIIFNLAVVSAADFGVGVDKEVVAQAVITKRLIKRANFELPTATPRHPHAGSRRRFNINEGPVQ